MAKAENEDTNKIVSHLYDEGFLVARINSGKMMGHYMANTWHPPKGAFNDLPSTITPEFFAMINDPPYIAGFSDILAIRPNTPPLVVEVKTLAGIASEMQEWFAQCWQLSGGIAIIPKGYEDYLRQYQEKVNSYRWERTYE